MSHTPSMLRTADGKWHNDWVVLVDHPLARSQARARQDLSAGTLIALVPSLSTALLPGEKSRRCDFCFRLPRDSVKKCAGCAEYWYCGPNCQNYHWKLVHRRICKHLPAFRASREIQSSEPHKRMDARLLSHLVSEYGERLAKDGIPDEDLTDVLATFCSLIPFQCEERHPPICAGTIAKSLPATLVDALYSRFSNNNFIVHSHLNSVGHGIFPLASRLFNHSCSPNAITTYEFTESIGVSMKVKALQNISENEEITIPYFDPALPYHQRQEICRYSYGFECTCPVCTFESSVGSVPDPPSDSSRRREIESALLNYVFPDAKPEWKSTSLLFGLPRDIYYILRENFLQEVSETFRDASHDGPYDIALRSGMLLMALYLVLYPRFYPQTGMHCLEYAKTAWNASVKGSVAIRHDHLLASSRSFLSMASESLSILGEEGDLDDGPLKEISALEDLLN